MKLFLGSKELKNITLFRDGNMPGFLETESGDRAYLTTEKFIEENPLTATASDIISGKVAVTSEGITTGTHNC